MAKKKRPGSLAPRRKLTQPKVDDIDRLSLDCESEDPAIRAAARSELDRRLFEAIKKRLESGGLTHRDRKELQQILEQTERRKLT